MLKVEIELLMLVISEKMHCWHAYHQPTNRLQLLHLSFALEAEKTNHQYQLYAC